MRFSNFHRVVRPSISIMLALSVGVAPVLTSRVEIAHPFVLISIYFRTAFYAEYFAVSDHVQREDGMNRVTLSNIVLELLYTPTDTVGPQIDLPEHPAGHNPRQNPTRNTR